MKTVSTFLHAGYCHTSPGNHIECLFEGGEFPAFSLSLLGAIQYIERIKETLQDCFEKESCIIPTSNGWFYQGQAALDRINQEIKALEDGTHWSFNTQDHV